ncbi:nicotinamide mononucleotide transporter PnuC-like protein [Psychroflexus torquis ATCC 700755]|uniref:Nicotinamide riboside transporter PnuC n=1 Tax=Psychroflexus torquis (strain ATCC 700755 / CIP 106069 / ACAM 623) TaxID=313595 RepID=K4IRV6_PSYTT|nr:nicotinamide riboside transporter PnuC [Psychroflexus torquis]AFU68205.1 nicotinamide mononucleotide transporter PnuC-like protein [Psychroflexus torquis ATCC 700755]
MDLFLDWLFLEYQDTPTHFLVLEIIAIIFGLLSVLFSKKDNILVFPTGIVSTLIFVYILYEYNLLGDMMINAYYFLMSIYGWHRWTQKVDDSHYIPIKEATRRENQQSIFIFLATAVFVCIVYEVFDKWDGWVTYVDVITTGIFFVGMWLMAKKRLENWIYWIIGDLISIPLYYYKGLTFTSFQYILFTIIAVYGFIAWRKNLDKPKTSLLK